MLAARWQALANGASPFLSWAWTGCLATERYPDPVLIEVREDGAVVGLALFNRRRDRLGWALHLHASGDAALDGVFIEQNGVVAAPGREAAVLAAMLAAAGGVAPRVVLPGVDDGVLAAARGLAGIVGPVQTRMAPYAALGARPVLEGMSRTARAQVRRSDRGYGGAIVVERAGPVAEGLDWLERLTALHGATWRARGVESAFLSPPVQRFHRALVARGGSVLLRVSAAAGSWGIC